MNLLICMEKKPFKVKLTEQSKKMGKMGRGVRNGRGKNRLCVIVLDGRKRRNYRGPISYTKNPEWLYHQEEGQM